MKNIFNLNSPFMRFLGNVADLILMNLLWIAGCIPIITIGTSTTALYQCLFKYRSKSFSGVYKEYRSAFIGSFRQATILFLIMIAVLVLLFLDLWLILFLNNGMSLLHRCLMLLPFLIPVLAMGYVFPLLSYFENSIPQLLKNAWMMSLAHFPSSAIIFILNIFPILLFLIDPYTFLRSTVIWFFFGGAAIAWLNTMVLHRIFQKYVPSNQESAHK